MLDIIKTFADWKSDIKGDLPEKHSLDVTTILNWVYAVAGLVAVGYLVISGIQYVYSAGDPGKATKAKNSILFAVIGLVIVLLAAAITNFVAGAIK